MLWGPFISWLLGNLPAIIKILVGLYKEDTCEDSQPDTALSARLRERLRDAGCLRAASRPSAPTGGSEGSGSVGA